MLPLNDILIEQAQLGNNWNKLSVNQVNIINILGSFKKKKKKTLSLVMLTVGKRINKTKVHSDFLKKDSAILDWYILKPKLDGWFSRKIQIKEIDQEVLNPR